ncbi:MAG: hypothetical protein M9948_14375 [Lentimicrobium sp.]|nr:hypothetical protein [Lentimicrobium sp.]
MKINCIAIDDEPLALDIIREYCEKVPFLNLQHTFGNAMGHTPVFAQQQD